MQLTCDRALPWQRTGRVFCCMGSNDCKLCTSEEQQRKVPTYRLSGRLLRPAYPGFIVTKIPTFSCRRIDLPSSSIFSVVQEDPAEWSIYVDSRQKGYVLRELTRGRKDTFFETIKLVKAAPSTNLSKDSTHCSKVKSKMPRHLKEV